MLLHQHRHRILQSRGNLGLGLFGLTKQPNLLSISSYPARLFSFFSSPFHHHTANPNPGICCHKLRSFNSDTSSDIQPVHFLISAQMSNPYPNLSTADDEDPDLKEAIRLSLMDNSSSSTTPKPTNKPPSSSTSSSYGTGNNGQIVVIDSDDEGTSNDNNNSNKNKQNNSNIINLTQNHNNNSSSTRRQTSTSSSSSTPKPPPSQTSQSSIFGLDRRGMERERLERLKRAAPPPDNSGSERPSKAQKSNDRAHGAIPSQNLFSDFPTRPISVQGIGSKSGPQYLNGVVKRTYIQGGNRTGADITLDEVLQKVLISTLTWWKRGLC